MTASLAAKRMRQQLSTMITHCQVTLITVDVERKVSMLEGALIRDTMGEGDPEPESQKRSDWFIGMNVYDVFSRLDSDIPAKENMEFLEPIEDVFSGRTAKGTREHKLRKNIPQRPPSIALIAADLVWRQSVVSYSVYSSLGKD